MNKILNAAAAILLGVTVFQAQTSVRDNASEIVKVDAKPASGFAYPYYLYVPTSIRDTDRKSKRPHTILVIPNNSGKTSDDFHTHEADVQRRIKNNVVVADQLGVAILSPVFPRPASSWKIYTHALDRDSMTTSEKDFARFDLQLIQMIDDARISLKSKGLRFDSKVMMLGFSASGMFTNRFTFLHPDRVKAAAIGSPGGWPIAPAESFDGKALRYPLGVGDLKAISGRELDVKELSKVSMFIFLGDGDQNDSVVFRDGYEQEDEELIFPLFGKTPVERWEKSKQLYREAKLDAEFRLYPNVKHTISKEMFDDVIKFFKGILNKDDIT